MKNLEEEISLFIPREIVYIKKRGAKSENKKSLNPKQGSDIQNMIIDVMPDQLRLEFALWTTKAVKELIEIEFGVVIGRRLGRFGCVTRLY